MRRSLSLLSLCLLAAACASKNKPASGSAAASGEATKAAAMVEAYVDAALARSPEKGREAGLHEYDGKVAVISQEEIDKSLAEAKAYLSQLGTLDLEAIPDPTRLDVDLTKMDAEKRIFRIETRQDHKRIMTYGDQFDVNGYLSRDYAPLEQRVGKMLDHLEALKGQVDAIVALQMPAQPRTHVATAKKMFEGIKEFYQKDLFEGSKPALEKDATLKTRYDKVVPEAIKGVEKILAWIDGPGTTQANDDFALGEANFLKLLEVSEAVTKTLPELEKMAQDDWARNHQAFIDTAKRIHPDLDTKAAAAKVASERLAADQVIPAAEKQLVELAAFIEANDIITISGNERATVKVTPPFMRWNSAFLDMGGPFEVAEGSFYYLSPPDPSWPKNVQEEYLPYEGDLLSTSIHEVYPGHFVHGLHSRKAATRTQKIFDSYAFTEGWAHYAEQMMFDAGFAKGDDKRKLGQLSNALLRNCRFIAAIGLHTKGMTVEQADELFREKCFIDPGNAQQQAYRGTFDPGYFSYTFGKLQILELREAYLAKTGKKSLREFHDWLLSFGGPPVALIKARL